MTERDNRRRKHGHLGNLGHQVENPADIADKAHIQHTVGLVEDDGVHIVEPDRPAVHVVSQASRRGDDNLAVWP